MSNENHVKKAWEIILANKEGIDPAKMEVIVAEFRGWLKPLMDPAKWAEADELLRQHGL